MSSVKFQNDATVRGVQDTTEDFAHRVGERLTGGDTQKGYLQVCSLATARLHGLLAC